MGDRTQRQPSWLRTTSQNVPWLLLATQSTAFVLLSHYSRVMTPAGGKRYLTSTAVFLNEVVKLAISLTMALYDVSKTAPPSMPATSLFFSLTSTVFSGDSWKLAVPAALGVLSNSLQYIALSNMRAATFQVTLQVQFLTTAIFGLWVWLWSKCLMPIQSRCPSTMSLRRFTFLAPWRSGKSVKGGSGKLHKRSATYEGIEEDIQTADPKFNATIGLLAIIGSALASGCGGVFFEKVLRDSSSHTSMWVRNVQLAIYSVFPAIFIGVGFQDGESVSNDGFFQGYNWAVWAVIAIQALGGILSTFSLRHSQRDPGCVANTATTIMSIVGSVWLFDFDLTPSFLIGSAIVLVATHYYGNPSFNPAAAKTGLARPPPIRVDNYEKGGGFEDGSPVSNSPNDFSIKLPPTPLLVRWHVFVTTHFPKPGPRSR
ncbi:hypothetical protein N7454_000991 [Penicillium verhagenii]|nr:hypothetical protein N7454_000991 [Penicillium verhagenii]